jgi:hypothetical protein
MTVPFTQPKPTFVEVVDLTNIGAGAPAQLTNMPSGVLGFEGVGDPYRVYAPGTLLYARVDGAAAGGLFIVAEDTTNAPVAIQIVRGSEPSGTGALLLYVVAEAGTPMAVTGTYPTVAAAITAAVAARGAATVPVDILVLPGTYAGFALQANVHVKALTEGASGQTTQATTTVNSTISLVASGAPCAASLSGLSVITGASTALDATNAANYTVTVNGSLLENNDAANPTVLDAAGTFVWSNTQVQATGGSSSFSGGGAENSWNQCRLSGPTGVGGTIPVARGTTINGVVTATAAVAAIITDTVIRANSAGGALVLIAGAAFTLRNSQINNTNQSLTVGGAGGTLTIEGGTTGIRTVAAAITVTVSQPLGAAYRRQNIAATATIADDTDVAVINLAAAGVITLPDPDLQLPDKELVLKRNDSNIVSCSITPPAGVEIDELGATVPVLLNPQGDYLRLRADRGNSRWNRC